MPKPFIPVSKVPKPFIPVSKEIGRVIGEGAANWLFEGKDFVHFVHLIHHQVDKQMDKIMSGLDRVWGGVVE